MIKKLIIRMLTAQTVSALTVSLCLLIDNIMIGQFLGVNALAAYGYANPLLLVIGALGSMLSAGVQVACSRSLGKGDQAETNRGYSSAVFIAALFSVLFVLIVVIFRIPFAGMLGANTPELLEQTSDYMAGFIIGAPASMGALILVPFLQMAGQGNLLIAAVLGMTVADVGFDLLNALVFHGGMFGMGLASSLSYYAAMIIGGWFFLSKKCVFRFSLKNIQWYKIKELLVGGVPTVIGMAASVVLVFCMNKIVLQPAGGKEAVAAFAVINTIGSACNCVSTGTGGVSLTISGILYHEEDRTGLGEFLRVISRYAVILGVLTCIVVMLCSPVFVGLFIRDAKNSYDMAVLGLRLFGLGIIPCCVNNALKSTFQGTGRVRTMEVLSVMENLILPLMCAIVLQAAFGMTGAWLYFAAGEALALLGISGYVWFRNHKVTLKASRFLMLNKGFGIRKEDLMEADIPDLNAVMEFSRQSVPFCLAHGKSRRLANHLALCIEEMGKNIVTYGIASDPGKKHLSIRIQCRPERCILRFRDDCGEFDPLHHIPDSDDPTRSIGIRLAMGMADEARYTYSLNLNNLVLVFSEP